MVSGNAIVYIYFISNCKTSKCDKEISFKSLLRLSRERSRVVGFHLRKSEWKKPQLPRVHDCDTHNSILAFQLIISFFLNIFVCEWMGFISVVVFAFRSAFLSHSSCAAVSLLFSFVFVYYNFTFVKRIIYVFASTACHTHTNIKTSHFVTANQNI